MRGSPESRTLLTSVALSAPGPIVMGLGLLVGSIVVSAYMVFTGAKTIRDAGQ